MSGKAMIISVGGTIEPIVTSLIAHCPCYVCFFASQRSLETIGDIKRRVNQRGLAFQDYKVICDDINDLVHCYEKALHCVEAIPAEFSGPGDVIVDYTGGTKTMTAALTLATVGHGYSFSYVGGGERTKDGLGVVCSGHEVVRMGISPWQIFAVEERKRVSLFVSLYQYEAALATIGETLSALGAPDRQIWSALARVLEGFLCWDNFAHSDAVKHFAEGLKQLEICAKFPIQPSLKDYLEQATGCFSFLRDMSEKTSFFKKLHAMTVRDLVSNARRRSLQGKYDDAVARLYRALEMTGQIAFEKETGCSTSAASPEAIPERLRDEYVQKYGQTPDRKLKLGLFATFRTLKERDNVLGLKFDEHRDALNHLLSARNNSILAHGVTPITGITYEKFERIIIDLFVDGPLIDFPRLDW